MVVCFSVLELVTDQRNRFVHSFSRKKKDIHIHRQVRRTALNDACMTKNATGQTVQFEMVQLNVYEHYRAWCI